MSMPPRVTAGLGGLRTGGRAVGVTCRGPRERLVHLAFARIERDGARVAVDQQHGLLDDRERHVARGHDRRDAEGPGDDGAVRGGAPRRHHDGLHDRHVERRGLRGRKVRSDQDPRSPQTGRAGDAREVLEHEPADLPDVLPAGALVVVTQRRESLRRRLDRLPPRGPGVAARVDGLERRPGDRIVVEQHELGVHDGRVGRPGLGRDRIPRDAQVGPRGVQRAFERATLERGIPRLPCTADRRATQPSRLADRDAGSGRQSPHHAGLPESLRRDVARRGYRRVDVVEIPSRERANGIEHRRRGGSACPDQHLVTLHHTEGLHLGQAARRRRSGAGHGIHHDDLRVEGRHRLHEARGRTGMEPGRVRHQQAALEPVAAVAHAVRGALRGIGRRSTSVVMSSARPTQITPPTPSSQ